MSLCTACILYGFCRKNYSPIVIDAELNNPLFVGSVRQHCYKLTKHHQLTPSKWHEFVIDLLRDTKVKIINRGGSEALVDTSVFEASDIEIDAGLEYQVRERIRGWFKATCCAPVNSYHQLHVRREARPRFITLATVICAAYPEEAIAWPRIWAANDNSKLPSAANDNNPQI